MTEKQQRAWVREESWFSGLCLGMGATLLYSDWQYHGFSTSSWGAVCIITIGIICEIRLNLKEYKA